MGYLKKNKVMNSNSKITSLEVQIICYLSVMSLFMVGCDKVRKNTFQVETKREVPSFPNISNFLEQRKFISRAGNRLGMDSDTEILFYADQEVTLVESGMDSVRYKGTFSIDKKTGEIELKLPKYKKIWPKMRLDFRSGLPLLFRSDGHTYITPDLKDVAGFRDYWPFAELANGDEIQ